MKQKKLWIGLILCAFFVWTGNASAAGPYGERQGRQLKRIEQGIENGSITRGEYKRLKKEQRKVAVMKRHARQDHHISRHEARRLARMQDQASRHIYRYKHNRAKQPWVRRHGHQHHVRGHHYHKPARHCRFDNYRAAAFSGALFQPGFSLAWTVPLD